MRYIVLLFVLASCAAANTIDTPARIPAPENDSCGAAEFSRFIGKHVTVLERVWIAKPVRLIKPDMMVTMEYREDRINFDLNDKNIITHIRCG